MAANKVANSGYKSNKRPNPDNDSFEQCGEKGCENVAVAGTGFCNAHKSIRRCQKDGCTLNSAFLTEGKFNIPTYLIK